MEIKRILLLVALAAVTITLIAMVLMSYKSNKRKYINTVPVPKEKKESTLLSNGFIKSFLTRAVTANGNDDDSIENLFEDYKKMGIGAVLAFLLFSAIGYMSIGIVVALILIVYPLADRFMRRKEFAKNYISDFYVFLNYIILYISGGLSVDKALTYAEVLIPETSLLKGRLKKLVAQKAISGLSGNTWLESLKILNEGYDFSEINSFIGAAERNLQRGDALTDTLTEQLDDIKKRVQLQKRQKIDNANTKFEVMRVLFCFLPLILMFCIPIFLTGMLMLSF